MRLPYVSTSGSVLFSIYITDLTTALKKATSIPFLEFTLLSSPIKKVNTIESSTLIKKLWLDDFIKGYVRKRNN